MGTPHPHDKLATVASAAGTPNHDEHRAIAHRIVRLQEQLTTERRHVEYLDALIAGANAVSFRNEDDIAEMTQRLTKLKRSVARREVELAFLTAQLERLRPSTP
jgi:uncharacterized coiled-coil protein SlyX